MQIDDMKVDDVYEIECRDGDGNRMLAKFVILEVGWYPSPTVNGIFFQGIRVRWLDLQTEADEQILDCIYTGFARKVETE